MSATPNEREYLFVRRPVLAIVISVTVTLLGILAMIALPINRYPQITPPSVQVVAVYPGASAQDVATSVAAPIEQQLAGLDGLLYYKSSNSSDGVMNLSVTFDISRNQDLAAVDVQNAISVASPQLPAAVRQNGITVTKANADILMVAALTSRNPHDDAAYLTNYGKLYIENEIKRLPGVGNASFFAPLDFSMLLSLDPEKMAHLGITVDDVSSAVHQQNATQPGGRLGREPSPAGTQLTIPVSTSGQLTTPDQFGAIIVRALPNGSLVRVRDIATVHLGSRQYDISGRLNGTETALMGVYARPGANNLAVKAAVVARLNELSKAFPAGVRWENPFDTTPFITESIREVIVTLAEAMALVTLVVFVFLQSWRATLIPVLAVPVSIIGTFLGLYALGFTINTLTLFGMVLAIGIVVDDAIVVIENVERIMSTEHVSARVATNRAMGQISGALIAIVLVLCSVFIPVAFVPGITGAMYKQFAATLVCAVLLSGMVALTLTPALCSLLLKETPGGATHGRFFTWFNARFATLTNGYLRAAGGVIGRPRAWFGAFAVALVLIGVLFRRVPGGFVPSEDKGYFALSVQLPDAASLQRTVATVKEVEGVLRAEPAVVNIVAIAGLDLLTSSNQTNTATIFVGLKPWGERGGAGNNVESVLGRVNGKLYAMKQAIGFGFNLPEIPGLGTTAGLEMNLQQRSGTDIAAFGGLVHQFVTDANKVATQGANGGVRTDVPQLFVHVDEDAARARGVGTGPIFATLQTMLSTLYINDFTLYGRPFRVQAEAEQRFRQKPEDVGRFYVRSATGAMIPVSALVTTEMRSAPSLLTRFNGFPAATITGTPRPGQSSGQMLAGVEKLLNDKYASQGVGFAYSGESYQEQASGGQAPLVLGLALVLVFLVLAAQYESWTVPFAVLLGVPFGLLGAVFAVWLRGMPNDVYFQVGLFAVIGLAAKNAILIVEFATELAAGGMSVKEAALEAARERFRPILMTSLAFILGVSPLIIASGAGAGSRHSLGTSVFFGMIGATALGLFFIPLFYSAIRGFVVRRATRRPAIALAAAATLGACAVGPSTRVDVGVAPVRAPSASATPAGTRLLLDSLGAARAAGVPTTGAAARVTSALGDSLRALWTPARLDVDGARDLRWSDVLRDPALVGLVNDAVSSSRDVRVAQARVREYRASLAVARSGFFPQVTANVTRSTNQTVFGPLALRYNATRIVGDATWELDVWGRVRRGTEAARFDLGAQEEDVRATTLALVSDVATAYLQIRELDENLALADQTVASRRTTLEIARRRFQQGVTSELDVRTFEAELADPATRVATLALQRTQQENRLAQLLGRGPGPIPRGAPLASVVAAVAVPDSIPGALLAQRPDVRASVRTLQASIARVGAAVASRLPTVSLGGDYGTQQPGYDNLFRRSGEIYTAQAGVSVPLFNGGRLAAQEREARARVDEARGQYEQTVLAAQREANDALAGVRLGRDQLVAQATQAQALQRAFDIAQARYRSGISTYLEVLDAQRQLFTAQLALVQDERQYLVATVDLFRALGGGRDVVAR